MKNNLLYILVISLLVISLTSCGNTKKKGKEGLSMEKMLEAENTEVNVSTLPSITFEEMKQIYEGTDFIDIIFYNVDFSMSVNNKTNNQKMVGFVSTNVASIDLSCQPMGRLFFQKNGELLVEADMYYDDKCRYFVFQKNEKAAYANAITPEGQAYFAKIFSQVKVESTTPPQ